MLEALAFSMLSSAASIVGGLLPIYTKVKDIGSRYILGFASGVVLAVVFFDMLPEMGANGAPSFLALPVGFFGLYLVEKLIMIHTCHEAECEIHTLGWVSIIGIGIHRLLDGIAIGVGFALGAPLGLGIAWAVIVHEFPRGFTTSAIMKGTGGPTKQTLLALGLSAALAPIGTALVIARVFPPTLSNTLLAFAAGTFIYIGASDLLPEAHKRFNIKVVMCVILGVVIIPAVELLTKL